MKLGVTYCVHQDSICSLIWLQDVMAAKVESHVPAAVVRGVQTCGRWVMGCEV